MTFVIYRAPLIWLRCDFCHMRDVTKVLAPAMYILRVVYYNGTIKFEKENKMKNETQIILLVPTRDSANQIVQILARQPEFKDIKIWSRDWPPIAVAIEAATDEKTARAMTLFINKFLGHA